MSSIIRVKLSAAQAAVLSGDIEYSTDGEIRVQTGRENTLASLRRMGLLNGVSLTVHGNNARITVQGGSTKVFAPGDGVSETFKTTPAPFNMLALTEDETAVLETNIGGAETAKRAALEAGWSNNAHHARYFNDGSLTLRADVDPAAYSSAARNADDTAREEGFLRLTPKWFTCFDYSYECMRVENETVRERAAFYAQQDAEDAAEAAAEHTTPATVMATVHDGSRIEYAHIPNGDPERVALYLAEAKRFYTDVAVRYDIAEEEAEEQWAEEIDAQFHATAAADRMYAEMDAEREQRAEDDRIGALYAEASNEPRPVITVDTTDRRTAVVTLPDGQSMRICNGSDVRLRAQFWARGHGYRPAGRQDYRFQWQRSGKRLTAPLERQ